MEMGLGIVLFHGRKFHGDHGAHQGGSFGGEPGGDGPAGVDGLAFQDAQAGEFSAGLGVGFQGLDEVED